MASIVKHIVIIASLGLVVLAATCGCLQSRNNERFADDMERLVAMEGHSQSSHTIIDVAAPAEDSSEETKQVETEEDNIMGGYDTYIHLRFNGMRRLHNVCDQKTVGYAAFVYRPPIGLVA
jgi:hypothetical protein